MPRILVVEDNRAIADLIGLYLRHHEDQVATIANGLNALDLFESESVSTRPKRPDALRPRNEPSANKPPGSELSA